MKESHQVQERRDIAGALLERFQGREDRLAVADGDGFIPEELDGPLGIRRLADLHLSDEQCLAFYIMRPDNKVTLSCLDFDNKPKHPDLRIEEKVIGVVECLMRHDIMPLVERSQSGRGAHVWIFFDRPLRAWFVRSFWRGVVEHVGIPVPEIYPRQDRLKGKGLGNAIRYPFFSDHTLSTFGVIGCLSNRYRSYRRSNSSLP